jgi:hypothetical protein
LFRKSSEDSGADNGIEDDYEQPNSAVASLKFHGSLVVADLGHPRPASPLDRQLF